MMTSGQKTGVVVGGVIVVLAVAAGAAFWRGETTPRVENMNVDVKTEPAPSMNTGTASGETVMAEPGQKELVNGRYQLDVKESSVGWYGARKVGNNHRGTIQVASGNLEIVNGAPKSGDVVIDMTTISSEGNDMLVKHLKSDEFFSVSAHPDARFHMTKIEKTDEDEFSVTYVFTGDMTIKGITQQVIFPARLRMSGKNLIGDATMSLDRTRWDIRYGSGKFFSDLGDKLINDEFDLTLSLHFTPMGQTDVMGEVK